MDIEFLRPFLLWSVAVNYAILMIWFLALVFAKDWIRRLHGRWFDLSPTTFDALHYGGMAVYKIGIMLFNLVPLLVLYIMGEGG
ncbi:MAG: hypothetical protein M0Q42_12660 [Xanthomonadales bacterium]|nr:hypothetical protein [Xanthomonadales bacterium]